MARGVLRPQIPEGSQRKKRGGHAIRNPPVPPGLPTKGPDYPTRPRILPGSQKPRATQQKSGAGRAPRSRVCAGSRVDSGAIAKESGSQGPSEWSMPTARYSVQIAWSIIAESAVSCGRVNLALWSLGAQSATYCEADNEDYGQKDKSSVSHCGR